MASYKNQSKLLRAAKFWLALIFYVVSNLFSIANADPIEIKSKFDDAITLGSHYQLVIDPDHTITINDILAPHSTVEFQPLTDGRFNLGYRPQTHWFKVEIINMTTEDLQRLLEFHFLCLMSSLSTLLTPPVNELSRSLMLEICKPLIHELISTRICISTNTASSFKLESLLTNP